MSHFYGVLDGSRGQATRCGTKNSGMTVNAMSWSGCVRVDIHHDETTGKDRFTVEQRQHPSNGAGICEEIAEGIIGETTAKKESAPTALDVMRTILEWAESRDGSPESDEKALRIIAETATDAIKKAEG